MKKLGKLCSIPFKLIHRLFGALMGAVVVTYLIAIVFGLIGGVVALILAVIVAIALWLCVVFATTIVGSALLSITRIFDPDYYEGKENPTAAVYNAVKEKGGDLQTMAKEHL